MRARLIAAILACACAAPAPAPTGGGVIVENPDAGPVQSTAQAILDAGVAAVEAVKASIEGVTLPPAPPLPAAPAFLGPVEDPKDNPTTPEKAALGWKLFFDKRMSKSGQMSCESCHHIDKAWTSGEALDKKDSGKMNVRNAPTMENLGYHANGFYWDGRMPTLEKVTNAAWTGQLAAEPAAIAARLNGIARYRAEFRRAFNEDATAENVPRAFAAFLRTLKGGDSPWDKFEQGDQKAVSAEARQGRKVFEETAHCTLCHVPPLYTDAQFHAVGAGASEDHGRMDATKDPKDDGKFKTPTMRDVARSAPYFHDGSVKTLDEAIEFMAGGGKQVPNLDEKLKPAKLSAKDKAALKAFLESLSGRTTYTTAPELP